MGRAARETKPSAGLPREHRRKGQLQAAASSSCVWLTTHAGFPTWPAPAGPIYLPSLHPPSMHAARHRQTALPFLFPPAGPARIHDWVARLPGALLLAAFAASFIFPLPRPPFQKEGKTLPLGCAPLWRFGLLFYFFLTHTRREGNPLLQTPPKAGFSLTRFSMAACSRNFCAASSSVRSAGD